MECANNMIHYGPMFVFVIMFFNFVLPHCHYYAGVSENIELLKILSDTPCRVCLGISQFSQLSFKQYIGLCIFRLSHYYGCWNMCTLSYYHQIRSTTHLPLFRVRSWKKCYPLLVFLYSLTIKRIYHLRSFILWLEWIETSITTVETDWKCKCQWTIERTSGISIHKICISKFIYKDPPHTNAHIPS